ncbi:hypothetical protein EG328_008530 [Venturia inaequalis]|uniref:HIT-type domain-containing protein n=1 Tax=Venturia inaequalis TaxID=5025 RepID=A0A8H3ZA10_VENIN|nr:hypothetical protein EG328_008530 [Venturia inaequalis]KAE9991209.1 hypothetical protein EG327_000330 [Venturia inaequalis]RDI84751.1 hypothetical protein Vi05172_g5501 [Venturia inaequalis]
MSDTLCGVCKTDPSKYKCPHCQLPYCSVKCFKAHILTHESDTNSPPSPTAQNPIIVDTEGRNPNTLTANDGDPANPYESLVQHPQFHTLFTKYPLLKTQLARVHNATKNPADFPSEEREDQRVNGHGHGRNQQGDRVKGQWTQEKANELAAEILVSLMDQDEGVREFMALRKIVFEAVERSGDAVVEQDLDVDVHVDANLNGI